MTQKWIRTFHRARTKDPRKDVWAGNEMPAHGAFAGMVTLDRVHGVRVPWQSDCEGFLNVELRDNRNACLMVDIAEWIIHHPQHAVTFGVGI